MSWLNHGDCGPCLVPVQSCTALLQSDFRKGAHPFSEPRHLNQVLSDQGIWLAPWMFRMGMGGGGGFAVRKRESWFRVTKAAGSVYEECDDNKVAEEQGGGGGSWMTES